MDLVAISRLKVGDTFWCPDLNCGGTLELVNECRTRVLIRKTGKRVKIKDREFIAGTKVAETWCLSVPVIRE